MQSVIYSHFNDLRRRKAATEGRDISIRTVAKETKLAQATVQRLASPKAEGFAGVRISTLETLCDYFNVASISELIEYRKD
jgi:DNA-binding Xre family transcriptional regulator